MTRTTMILITKTETMLNEATLLKLHSPFPLMVCWPLLRPHTFCKTFSYLMKFPAFSDAYVVVFFDSMLMVDFLLNNSCSSIIVIPFAPNLTIKKRLTLKFSFINCEKVLT